MSAHQFSGATQDAGSTTPFEFPTQFEFPSSVAGPAFRTNEITDTILREVSSQVAARLPAIIQQAWAAKTTEMFSQIQEHHDKVSQALHSEINRLSNVIEGLREPSQKKPPHRHLHLDAPHITLELKSQADVETIDSKAKSDIVKELGTRGAPFDQIGAVYLRGGPAKELFLFVYSQEAYLVLNTPDNICKLTEYLGLDVRSTSNTIYWVLLLHYQLPLALLRACVRHRSIWANETGLNIHKVEYKANMLIWGFSTISEAEKACGKPIHFSGSVAKAIPFDKRQIPIFCRRCGCPGHMTQSSLCLMKPKNNKDEDPWQCLYCAKVHDKQPNETGHQCPNKDKEENHRCLNCGGRHKTEHIRCPDPRVREHRDECRKYGEAIPFWAVSLDIPSVLEIPKSSSTENNKKKGKGKSSAGSTAQKKGAPTQALPRYTVDTEADFINPEAAELRRAQKGPAQRDGATASSPILVASQVSGAIDADDTLETPSRPPSTSNPVPGVGEFVKGMKRFDNTPKTPKRKRGRPANPPGPKSNGDASEAPVGGNTGSDGSVSERERESSPIKRHRSLQRPADQASAVQHAGSEATTNVNVNVDQVLSVEGLTAVGTSWVSSSAPVMGNTAELPIPVRGASLPREALHDGRAEESAIVVEDDDGDASMDESESESESE